MVWLCFACDGDKEELLSAFAHVPLCWLVTEQLPDDSRPALVITRNPDLTLPPRRGKTVALSVQRLQGSPEPVGVIQAALAQLGVPWQSGPHYQQLVAKERVIQQLLRYRASSLKYWLVRGLAQPARSLLARFPLLVGLPTLWSCFEQAQHLPIPMRPPGPVPPPGRPLSISLVTPSYGQAEFLERTLLSVLGQGYPWLHYRVQDGGSSDGSVSILEKYQDRLGGWESAPDGGQAQAINRGFAHSQGEIMGWLNSDDLLLPGALNYVARYFLEHPQVDLVYGHRVLIDRRDQEIGRWLVPPGQDEILGWADLIPQETMFWRRSLWEKVGGRLDESFQFALDWDLLLRFREVGASMRCLPRFLGAFRIHDQQKTSAQILTIGEAEMFRLRERSLGRRVNQQEVFEACCPFYRRAKRQHFLYRMGWLKVQ